LFYYLIFLFTGNSRWLKPLVALYTIFYILIIYIVTASHPVDVILEPWSTPLDYEFPPAGPFVISLLVLLLASQLLGGLAYFTLYFQVPDVTQKYRILLVSWSIIIWFLSPFVGVALGLAEQDWWQLASRFLGLAAALTILMAYQPPQWLKQRYGILSLSDERNQGLRSEPARRGHSGALR
jgi:MFS family permease